MTTTHTPGPWEVAQRTTPGQFVTETHIIGPHNDHVALVGPCEIDANARLIAAAPDLLDEARKQVTWLRHLRTEAVGSLRGSLIDGIDQSIKYLSAAIAKAKGEKS